MKEIVVYLSVVEYLCTDVDYRGYILRPRRSDIMVSGLMHVEDKEGDRNRIWMESG